MYLKTINIKTMQIVNIKLNCKFVKYYHLKIIHFNQLITKWLVELFLKSNFFIFFSRNFCCPFPTLQMPSGREDRLLEHSVVLQRATSYVLPNVEKWLSFWLCWPLLRYLKLPWAAQQQLSRKRIWAILYVEEICLDSLILQTSTRSRQCG